MLSFLHKLTVNCSPLAAPPPPLDDDAPCDERATPPASTASATNPHVALYAAQGCAPTAANLHMCFALRAEHAGAGPTLLVADISSEAGFERPADKALPTSPFGTALLRRKAGWQRNAEPAAVAGSTTEEGASAPSPPRPPSDHRSSSWRQDVSTEGMSLGDSVPSEEKTASSIANDEQHF